MKARDYVKKVEELNNSLWTGSVYDLYRSIASEKVYITHYEEQGYINDIVADSDMSAEDIFTLLMTRTLFCSFRVYKNNEVVDRSTFYFSCTIIFKDNETIEFEGSYEELYNLIGIEKIDKIQTISEFIVLGKN